MRVIAEGDRALSIALRQYTLIRPIRTAKCICPTLGDSSTILLRKIASGTAQNDSVRRRHTYNQTLPLIHLASSI